VVICTVIQAEPNVVTQIKRKELDGYDALQLGYEKIIVKDARTIEKRLTKQLLGHFKKGNVEPRRYLAESRVSDVESYSVGQELGVTLFQDVNFVDVSATSKGKGYQGVMKRYGFKGGPAAHGSGFHRHGGSTGMRSTPGRTLQGQKKAGQMGSEQVTVQNLRIVAIDEELHLIIVEGAVPGPRGGLVSVTAAKKKRKPK
ncbi:MAG: 50S ribosomal protein L3, partial [Chlamydiales bacterium]